MCVLYKFIKIGDYCAIGYTYYSMEIRHLFTRHEFVLFQKIRNPSTTLNENNTTNNLCQNCPPHFYFSCLALTKQLKIRDKDRRCRPKNVSSCNKNSLEATGRKSMKIFVFFVAPQTDRQQDKQMYFQSFTLSFCLQNVILLLCGGGVSSKLQSAKCHFCVSSVASALVLQFLHWCASLTEWMCACT